AYVDGNHAGSLLQGVGQQAQHGAEPRRRFAPDRMQAGLALHDVEPAAFRMHGIARKPRRFARGADTVHRRAFEMQRRACHSR
ncbi:hypothetical protein COL27_27905, partial [Bacillus sp. AFS075960]